MVAVNLSPAGEWDECGNHLYHRSTLYDIEEWQGSSLEASRVACASYGGPAAMVRDERRMVQVSGAQTPMLRVYTAAGKQLGSVAWEQQSIAAMAWTLHEELMVLDQAGEVRLFSMHGQQLSHQFSLGAECAREGVLQACLFPRGLAVITKSHHLWVVTDLAEPRPRSLAPLTLTTSPQCMAVIEGRHTNSGSIEVLLGVGSAITVVDEDSAQDHTQLLGSSSVTTMAVSPNGQFLAAFTQDGRLIVLLADLTRTLSEFSTQSDAQPDQMGWCGTDSVVLVWKDLMLMVGPLGEWVRYTVESPCVLAPECDGIRIISQTTHELLRRVPDPLADVFRPGSTAPGALLFDARCLFDGEEARADEVLRSIATDLPEAVATCAAAAAADHSPARQAALLKAAVYGRAFCSVNTVPPDLLLRAAVRLRILNSLRDPSVGVPLTDAQLTALSPAVLVDRLANSRRHLLALRMAAALDLPTNKILSHWACAKVDASGDVSDEELQEALTGKLRGQPGVQWATIARHAQAKGRRPLAALLLEHESSAAEQVPLLLGLGEEVKGLDKGLEAGDADLIYLALFQLWRSRPLPSFLQLLNARPLARALFFSYAARKEPDLLKQIFATMNMPESLAELEIKSAIRMERGIAMPDAATSSPTRPPGARRAGADTGSLQALQCLSRASDLFGQSKDGAWQSKAATEWRTLRQVQGELEMEKGQAVFLGTSLAATVRKCIHLGDRRSANKLRDKFHISERRFAWLVLNALAESKDWDGLEAFSRERKPAPVTGYEPFIGACKNNSAPNERTARFIARLPDAKRKAEEYAAVGMYQEAAEMAAQSKDSDMLSKIQGIVGSASQVGIAVTQFRNRLAGAGR